jgi:hypothetical protein
MLLWLSPLAGAAAPPAVQRFDPRPLDADELLRVPRDGTHLLLAGAVFDPTRLEPDFGRVGLPAGVDGAWGIVQFLPGRLDAKERLAQAGVDFTAYLPDNAFAFRRTLEAEAQLAASDGVRYVGPYRIGYKIDPRLWPGRGVAGDTLTLRLFPGVSADEVEQALVARVPEARKQRRSDDSQRHPRFAAPLAQRDRLVAEAAQLAGVAFVELYVDYELHNNNALGPVQSNVATTLAGTNCTTCTIFNRGLTGTGQVVAVADSGNDSDMCFFRNDATAGAVTDAQSPLPPSTGTLAPAKKLVAYYVQPGATSYDNNVSCAGAPATAWHGTHTSGTVTGDNFSTLSTPGAAGINPGDGMAPNAKLVFQDVGNDTTGCLSGLSDPYNMYLQARNAGARVHSNSYGAPTGGAYTADDASADRFLFDHDDMTIFFSAGNDGAGANTIGSPGNSKNVVTVGALGSANSTTVAGFSSRGPTDDGRIKPDIMAPGTVVSASGDSNHATNNCGTKTLSGTSMACPATAGGAALLRQYFEDGYYPSGAANAADALSPRAALVKALLLNGTRPLPDGSTFGNNNYGWGRIFLDNNLFFTGDGRELRVFNPASSDGLQSGGSHTYQVTVAAGQEFRATLVWVDPEASPGVATTLVNNLNLSVNDGASTYLGNVFNASGVSQTGGSADAVNNVEQVRLTAPVAGSYTLTVAAPAVPGNGRPYTNRQGYALVVSYAACASAVGAAPTGVNAASNPTMGVDLSWTSAAGATVTQIYRAVGNCSAPAKDFQYIGSSAGSSFTDARAQGSITYAYKLRGADGCGEGPASACVTITPTGRCDLVPPFAGLSTATGGYPDGTRCRVRLGWNPTSSSCPAGPTVRYNIYRSTTPSFTPGAGNLLATTTATLYDDNDPSVSNNTTYYYVVRAEDSTSAGGGPNGGNEEPNSLRLFATALGAPAGTGTFNDGAGDGNAYGSPESPWRVTASEFHSGAFSYHPGPDSGLYPANTCAALVSPPLTLAAGASLSYWVRYNVEYQWDGVVVEISTNGGATWNDLPPTGGYPSNLSQTQGNGCGYPTTQGAFNGPTTNAGLTTWAQYTTSLAAYAGQTVKIRWRFTSDGGAEFQGFYLDDVAITNVNLPGTCVPTPVELQHLHLE